MQRCDARFAADDRLAGRSRRQRRCRRADSTPQLPVMRAIGLRRIARLRRRRRSIATSRRGRGRAGDAALRQAPIYLVRAPAARRLAALCRTARPDDASAMARGAGACRSPATRPTPRLRRSSTMTRHRHPAPLAGKRVAIIGYGNQGRAQALNLRDSGMTSSSACATDRQAPAASRRRRHCRRRSSPRRPPRADLVMLLAPDETLAATYRRDRAAI